MVLVRDIWGMNVKLSSSSRKDSIDPRIEDSRRGRVYCLEDLLKLLCCDPLLLSLQRSDLRLELLDDACQLLDGGRSVGHVCGGFGCGSRRCVVVGGVVRRRWLFVVLVVGIGSWRLRRGDVGERVGIGESGERGLERGDLWGWVYS